MKDYTLSPVFNIRGREIVDLNSTIKVEDIFTDGVRKYIPIDKYTSSINNTDNCKGVFRIKYNAS